MCPKTIKNYIYVWMITLIGILCENGWKNVQISTFRGFYRGAQVSEISEIVNRKKIGLMGGANQKYISQHMEPPSKITLPTEHLRFSFFQYFSKIEKLKSWYHDFGGDSMCWNIYFWFAPPIRPIVFDFSILEISDTCAPHWETSKSWNLLKFYVFSPIFV